jgi:hypothetical protein
VAQTQYPLRNKPRKATAGIENAAKYFKSFIENSTYLTVKCSKLTESYQIYGNFN